MEMRAPILLSTAIYPVLVGFRQISRSRISEPFEAAAHTAGNAAEEGSPGTCTSLAERLCGPLTRTVVPSRSICAPKYGSMRSVWSRLSEGSLTVVTP